MNQAHPKGQSAKACSSFLVFQIAIGLCLIPLRLHAEDWPQWRGPTRNGVSKETGLLAVWPKEGPKLLWQVTDLGSGYSAPAVVGNRLYVLANEGMDSEFIQAHAVKDGTRAWRTPLGKVGPNNPQMNFAAARSTPTVDGDFIYALGSDGDVTCLETKTGKVQWQKNLRKDFGGKPGDWAYAESPLVDGNTLVCTPGGADATLLALNKKTGDVIWKCATPEGDPAAFGNTFNFCKKVWWELTPGLASSCGVTEKPSAATARTFPRRWPATVTFMSAQPGRAAAR